MCRLFTLDVNGAKIMVLDTLRKFVLDHGPVSIVDSAGKTRTLKDDTLNVWEFALKADRFHYAGRWHGRTAFENLMDMHITRLGNVTEMKTD
jgi:hypothetical protein